MSSELGEIMVTVCDVCHPTVKDGYIDVLGTADAIDASCGQFVCARKAAA